MFHLFRAAFDLSQSNDEEKADFAKLKSKWEALEETVDAELKSPVPEINWADWSKKIKDSSNVVGAWKKVSVFSCLFLLPSALFYICSYSLELHH
jgi:hypothetical protein